MKSSLRVFTNVSDRTRKNMSHIKGKDTSIEVKLRKALWNNGIRYRKNYKALPGKPDIAVTKYKIAIFCDSEYFHGKDWEKLKARLEKGNNPTYWITRISENMARDRRNDALLNGLGWSVIHFWGSDIKDNIEECLVTVKEAIDEKILEDDVPIV